MENIWLFQADTGYDLTKEIVKDRKDDWALPHHRKDVSEGDPVILWQSGGEAGIYGFGRLASAPIDKGGGNYRIDIEYAELLEKPLLRPVIKADPVLQNLLVLKQAFGKNPFRVKGVEWGAIMKLLGRGMPPASP